MYTSVEDAMKVIALLCEGVGINADSRLTGMNKETILKVLVQPGERCAKLMAQQLRDLAMDDVQCDEIWSFVGKKQNHLTPKDNEAKMGDFYTFCAIDRTSKLIITSLVGKQNAQSTHDFMMDLADRITGDVQWQRISIRAPSRRYQFIAEMPVCYSEQSMGPLRSDFLFASPSFLSGIARIFDIFGYFDSYNESRNGTEADSKALFSDWSIIGQEIKSATNSIQHNPNQLSLNFPSK